MKIFNNDFKTQKSIHFIGIGGAGMAPLASISFEKGFCVSGSDEKNSEIIENLKNKGIKINIGHKASNIGNVDYVVYSAAVKETNLEFIEAKEKNIVTIKRSKFLGELLSNYSKSIAVSGSHGKSTSSLMCMKILSGAGRDPTAIIGAELKGNVNIWINGKSDYAVCEACEFADSFLDLEPSIGIILNIDNDHLDYFGNIEKEKESFSKFAKKCYKSLIINGQDYNTVDCIRDINTEKIFYGIKGKESFKKLDFYAKNLTTDEFGFAEFDIVSNVTNKNVRMKLKIPGVHNVFNALASCAACERLGVDLELAKESLINFTGAKRRFEFIGEVNGISIFDDYAHHPSEINALYDTIYSINNKRRNWIIFQSHTFSRTFLLMDDFVNSLNKFDNVIIADIFASREKNEYGITSEKLAKKIENCRFFGNFNQINEFITKNVDFGDLILTVGAGNIDECGRMIFDSLKSKFKIDNLDFISDAVIKV